MAVKYARETVEAAIESSCAMMGIQKLKEKQKDAITLFVDGNDVLVILPTELMAPYLVRAEKHTLHTAEPSLAKN